MAQTSELHLGRVRHEKNRNICWSVALIHEVLKPACLKARMTQNDASAIISKFHAPRRLNAPFTSQ